MDRNVETLLGLAAALLVAVLVIAAAIYWAD